MSSLPLGRRRAGLRPRVSKSRPSVEALEQKQLLATFTVTSNASSGTGTLRQAIVDANAAAGADLIDFNLPTGQRTIVLDQADGQLPEIVDPVTISGSVAVGTGLPSIELSGQNVSGDGLRLSAGSSVVRGLAINRFSGAGIRISSRGGNLVESVHLGTDVAGNNDLGNTGPGLFIGSANNTIGGVGNSGRVLSSGNSGDGIQFLGVDASGNVVTNTYIGMDRAGGRAIPNEGQGLLLSGASANTIGGTTTATRNVISGNSLSGVAMIPGSNNNVIQGNLIGVAADGTSDLGNLNHGVFIDGANDNTIGGNFAGAGNLIANNGGTDSQFNGVTVEAGTGNTILTNRIVDNAGLGIDLGGDGQTPNDDFDADTGPNGLQNYPVLFGAFSNSTETNIQGLLQSTPNTVFTLQFFENIAADVSGFGEGRRLLGETTITTDANGLFLYSLDFNPPASVGSFITATATSPTGDTSEFSAAVEVQDGFFRFVDVALSVNDTPDPLRTGEVLTYDITLDNRFFAASNVILSISLPDSVQFDDTDLSIPPVANAQVIRSGNDLTIIIPQLGDFSSLSITLDVVPSLPELLVSQFSVANADDTQPGNNSATTITQVTLSPDTSVLNFRTRNYSISESGDLATIEVVRSNNAAGTVSVDYQTFDDTATAGDDYVASSGTLTFGPNELTKTFTIPILNNEVVDANRTVRLGLSNATGTGIVGVPSLATLTIFDDDPVPAQPQFLQFSQASSTVQENGGEAKIVVRRTGGIDGVVSIPYSTAPGSAVPGEDFTPVSGMLTFLSGETEKTIVVPVIDNAEVDGNRDFLVSLGQGTGAAAGTPSQARITIVDDESPPAGSFEFSMAGYTVSEADGRATITVTRSGGSGPASVSYATVPGTARPGERYQPASGTLEFGPGETVKTFTVDLIDTPGFVGPQTVILELTPGDGASLGAIGRAILTITDDEAAPQGVFQFDTSSIVVDEAAGVARLTVIRAGGAFDAASIGVATAVGNAVAGTDYESIAVRLTFAPGETSKTVEIPILDNDDFDGDRAFGVFLGYPEGNAAIGDPGSAVVLIRDNDPDPIVPFVTDVRSIGFGGSISTVAIFFNKAMAPESALSPGNYVAVAHGRDGVLGTADDRSIPIAGVGRSDDGLAVALSLASAVPQGEFLTVAVNGLAGGLTDASGSLLDGDGDGVAGGNFSTSLVRASGRFSYRDTDGDLITYAATGGGVVEVTRGAPGTGDVVRVLDAVPGRTVLRGQVVRQRGGDGLALIRRLEGIDPFGRVRSALRTPPFVDLSQIAPAAVDAILASQARRTRR
ncbi:Calx-beta domain-containing protein [Tautonia plasticadhaerens]|uniref:Calx-beta domain protein n=1 Tax=Tautonia plasticadhaerens TaxID=2527974 RepID=A0A518HBV3_9BACT|nr:Calx-beta domain-containing protein [Tautonia plasticadhaerens]QDV38166.1 Calx-beta domain protein [Tautonia plasticadhaerens]